MKHLITFFLLFSLLSCGNTSYKQKMVLKKVGDFYGGSASASSGFDTHNATKVNHFTIRVNNSPLIINDLQDISFHVGNIAYLVYSNLEGNKDTYDEYRISINLPNSESRNYTFLKSQLKEASSLIPIVDDFNSTIIRKDYDNLDKLLNSNIVKAKDSIVSIFTQLHEKYGNIKQIQYQGFEFMEDEALGKFTFNKQVIVFDKENVNMYLATTPKNNTVVGVSFQ